MNDAPEILNLEGPTLAYLEGSAPVVLDPDGDAMLRDVDTVNFENGWLVIDFAGADLDDDKVIYDDRLGIQTEAGKITLGNATFLDIGVSSVLYDGTTIGMAYLENGVGEKLEGYDDASGPGLSFDFFDTADSEAISALIQSITYENVDTVNPDEGERTIRFKMMDGDNRAPDQEWITEETSRWYEVTVVVEGKNDAPEIENLAGDTLVYPKNGGMMALDQGTPAVVFDLDSADLNGGKLTVEITNDAVPDTLGFHTLDAGITLVGNDVYYQANKIGTYDLNNDGDKLTVDLNTAQAGTESVGVLVQSIAFENTNTISPLDFDRAVRFTLADGEGAVSEDYTVTVDVQSNQVPEVIQVIPEREVSIGDMDTWSVAASFDDPDDDATNLTFSAQWVNEDGSLVSDKLPSWLLPSTNGMFIALPEANDMDDSPVWVKVIARDIPETDLNSLAETTFKVTLVEQAVNHAPNFVKINADGEPVDADDVVLSDPAAGDPVIDPNVTFTISEHEEVPTEPTDELRSVDVDAKLVAVKGWDVDDGDTATLEYRITGGNGAGNFAIDSDTGEIRVSDTGKDTPAPETADDLNFETGPKAFTLHVEVKDTGGKIGNGVVTILIQDQNDEPKAVTVPQQEVKVNQGWFYDIEDANANMGQVDIFSDEDGDILEYTATLEGGADLSTTGWLNFSSSASRFAGAPINVPVDTLYTISLTADDHEGGVTTITFEIKIVASLDHGLRDALRYLDDVDGDYFLPADGEDMEMSEMVMVADAGLVEEVSVDAEMLEALSLLDLAMVDEPAPMGDDPRNA